MEPRLLALWSAPRCRSTAFLRMMEERGDVTVLHEPFSHVTDFGVTKVGEREVRSERELIPALRELAAKEPVFFKDTTDFRYPELLGAADFLRETTHAFMIRDPKAAIASHYRLNPGLGRDEIGFAWLHEIYEAVVAAKGEQPIVIDGDDLAAAPRQVVETYCVRVGIPFVASALEWEPKRRRDWQQAARWHDSVSESSGFDASMGANDGVDVKADPTLRDFLRYHQPYYEKLYERRLRV
jgi:sulfotransferase family protein